MLVNLLAELLLSAVYVAGTVWFTLLCTCLGLKF